MIAITTMCDRRILHVDASVVWSSGLELLSCRSIIVAVLFEVRAALPLPQSGNSLSTHPPKRCEQRVICFAAFFPAPCGVRSAFAAVAAPRHRS